MIDQAQNLRELMQQRQAEAKLPISSPTALKLPPKPKVAGKGRFLTVVSGKGGVGKSNVALNLAIAYGAIGKKTIILDADLGMANVNVLMGIVPRYNISHIITHNKTLKDVVVETEYGISLIAGASGISQLANATEEARLQFLEEIQGLGDYDIIIVDTGAGASSNVVAFAEAADDVIVVTTQEPTAITDAYSMIKILSQDAKQINNLHLVINRVYSSAEGEKVADKLLGISKQFLSLPLDYLGFVYEDPLVRDSVKKQKPFFWSQKKARSSQCISQLVNKLEKKEEERENSGVLTFFSKLFKSI
jgi:flagellar biosynthesis protein FlhG